MHVDDISYKAVIAWIQDLADIEHGRYESTAIFRSTIGIRHMSFA